MHSLATCNLHLQNAEDPCQRKCVSALPSSDDPCLKSASPLTVLACITLLLQFIFRPAKWLLTLGRAEAYHLHIQNCWGEVLGVEQPLKRSCHLALRITLQQCRPLFPAVFVKMCFLCSHIKAIRINKRRFWALNQSLRCRRCTIYFKSEKTTARWRQCSVGLNVQSIVTQQN